MSQGPLDALRQLYGGVLVPKETGMEGSADLPDGSGPFLLGSYGTSWNSSYCNGLLTCFIEITVSKI